MKVNSWDKCFLCLTNLGSTSSSLNCDGGGGGEKKARGRKRRKTSQNQNPITNNSSILIKYLLGTGGDEKENDSLLQRILQLQQPTSSSAGIQIQFCLKCQDSAGQISQLHRELEVIQMKIVEILGSLRKTVVSKSVSFGTGNDGISRMGFEQKFLDTLHEFQAAVFEKSKQSSHIPLVYVEKFTGFNPLKINLSNRTPATTAQDNDQSNLIKTEPMEADSLDEGLSDFGGDDSHAADWDQDDDHDHIDHPKKEEIMDTHEFENSNEEDQNLNAIINLIKEEHCANPIDGRRKSAQTAARRIAELKNLSKPKFQHREKKVAIKRKKIKKVETKSSQSSQDPTKIILTPILKPGFYKPKRGRPPIKPKSSKKAASKPKQIHKWFQCELCPYKTHSPFKFEHHLREHESLEVINHTCPHCQNTKFSHKQSLDYHMSSHAGLNKMMCDICTKLVDPIRILEHLRGHSNIQKIFQCSGCSYCCATRDSYVKHTRLHRTAALVCDVCSRKFRNRQKFLDHMHDEHKLLEKIKCPVENCDKEFFETPTLVLHKKLHTQAFVCLPCDLRFPAKHMLQLHEIRKHSREKPYPCPECPEAFLNKGDLQRHAINAHGATKLQCPYCEKEYSDQGNLSAHMNLHEGNSIQCDICHKLFGNRSKLTKHQEWHSTTKDVICEECGKACINKQSLRSHMKIHAEEKKYKCSYCPKAFVTKDNLIRHERIHTGERPYVCEACGKDFNQAGPLKQHMKIHHKETVPRRN